MADREEKKGRHNKSHVTVAFVCMLIFHLFLGCFYPLWYFRYDCSTIQKEYYKEYEQLSSVLNVLKEKDSDWDGRYAYSESSFLRYEIITQEYVALAKKIQILGVKYLIFDEKYNEKTDLINSLNEMGYVRCSYPNTQRYIVLVKQDADLKISHAHNEALVVGKNVEGLVDSFPYFSYSKRGLFDYSVDELAKYKMIYYVPNDIDTISQKEKAEEMLKELSAKGTMVIIEPVYDRHLNLFDIHMEYKPSGNTVVLYATNDAPANFPKVTILESQKENVGTFFGTSSHNLIPYVMMQNGNTAQARIVFGSLNFDNARIFFVGNRLSEYLLPVYVRSFGPDGKNYSNAIINSSRVKVFYNELVSYRGINREIYFRDVDEISNVVIYGDNINYGKKSFTDSLLHVKPTKILSFDYDLDSDTDILISKLYDAHYRAYIDGKRIKVNDCEDVLAVSLSAGKHNFLLKHEHSVQDMIAIFISWFGILSFIIDIVFCRKLNYFYKKHVKGTIEYFNEPCVGGKKLCEIRKGEKKEKCKEVKCKPDKSHKQKDMMKDIIKNNGPYVYVKGKGTQSDSMLTYDESQSDEDTIRRPRPNREPVIITEIEMPVPVKDETVMIIQEAKPMADFDPRKFYKRTEETVVEENVAEEIVVQNTEEDTLNEELMIEIISTEDPIIKLASVDEIKETTKTENTVLEIETAQINDESEEQNMKKKKVIGNILREKLNDEEQERTKDIEVFVLKS